MPIREMPQFKSTPDKMLEIPQPAIGGLNLKDLEFEQEVNQTPNMLNVMYRNGAFGKRYGQELLRDSNNNVIDFGDTIHAIVCYGGFVFVHAGTKIYRYVSGSSIAEVGSGFPESEGLFIIFAQKLYYLISSGLYSYENNTFSTTTTYAPDYMINCKPDGTSGDGVGEVFDDLNIIGNKAKWLYNSDGTTTTYHVTEYNDQDVIDWTTSDGLVDMTVEVDDEEWTQVLPSATLSTKQYKVVSDNQIEFYSAPPEGDLNVVMTFAIKSSVFASVRAKLLSCKFYDTFGGANNSRLFLAGAGNSTYYWSQSYDITYFPENNWARLGNTEDDITGFGRQYNVLIVFKPKEVYSIYSYTETSSTTVLEENIGMEGFRSQLVNPRIGCDAPYSIQLIDNLLTWFNSDYGICTLVSTNIQDERNVRIISRNIEHTNNFAIKGILDYTENPMTIQSMDYDNKYFLVFPTSGFCFMWDYEISPYKYSTNSGETNPRQLDWFMFDHFFVKRFIRVDKDLLYVSSHEDFDSVLVKLNDTFVDLDFDGDGHGDAIHSHYMTPFMQFGAVEMLKNIKNLYVQCRGDTNTLINLYYYTEESALPEAEPESINVAGGQFWSSFTWSGFHWFQNSWANTFRRKCNIKKVQMASIYFENNEVGKDMSVTHIGMQYQLVKYVR